MTILRTDLPIADGSIQDEEADRLGELARGARVLELGSLVGRSTVAMAREATVLFSVDWHKGDEHMGVLDTLGTFLGNLVQYGVRDKVVPIVAPTSQVLPTLAPGWFDLVFIDATHTYEAVKSDINMAAPLVRDGGVIACHDYFDLWDMNFGSKQAIDEFCEQTGWKISEEVLSMVVLRR